MTPDTTRSSRELDWWIAEHICGWEWWRSSSSGRRALFAPGVIPRKNLPNGEWFLERATGTEPLVNDWDYCQKDIPRYTSDRAAAFELLWTFERRLIFATETECEVQLFGAGMQYHTAYGKPEDFALLICQTAIKAKGQQ